MSKKEKVSILRTDDFEVVDEALSEAINGLVSTNIRITEFLEQETTTPEEEAAAGEPQQSDASAEKPIEKEDADKDA